MKRYLVIVGLSTVFAMSSPAGDPAQPGDLTPVTQLAAQTHAPVVIVRDGQAPAVVFVADRAPGPALKRLVDELVEVVRLSTGVTLERVEEAPGADRSAIVIGDCEETRRAEIDAGKIAAEGFEVKTAPNRVFLVGSTQAPQNNDGAAWAVADFLERFVGVRWYWPTVVGGRCITRSDALVIPPVHYRDAPVFHQREYHPRAGWKLPTEACHFDRAPLPFPPGVIPDGVKAIDMGAYLPLVRSGGSWPYRVQCHEPQDLHRLPEKFLQENKDMFALKKNGTRDFHMFCYSSQKALDYLLQGCERVWDGNGACSWVTPTCVTVSPGDSKMECYCPTCRATSVRGGGGIEGDSLIVALFVKRMCEAVKQRWPDKKVIYLSYWNYQECPREVEYPDNLAVMAAMTTYPMPLNAQAANFRDALDRLHAWRSKASVPVTTWDYCVGWTHGPYQYPHVVRDFQKAVKDTGAGTFINGWTMVDWTTTAPTLYVWMKCLWNPELDVDVVLDEMCRRLYGKAGGTARELMRLECDLWEAGEWRNSRVRDPGAWAVPRSLFPRVWTPDIVSRLKALRDKALTELGEDPVARQRFLYWTWTFDTFLEEAERAKER